MFFFRVLSQPKSPGNIVLHDAGGTSVEEPKFQPQKSRFSSCF